MAESTGILLLNAEDNSESGLTITEEGSNNFSITTGAALHGTYGYNFAFSGNTGENLLYFYKSFTSGADIYARCYFYIPSGFGGTSEYMSILSLYDASGNYLAYPRLKWNGTTMIIDHFNYRINSGTQSSSTINQAISLGAMHYIEMRYKSGPGSGEVQCWYDGTSIASASGLTNDMYQASQIWAGNWRGVVPTSGSKIYVDDIKVDSSYIGAYAESGGAFPSIINNYRQQGVM